MKNPVSARRESAVALIIVLAMLLLLSGLIVSFMTSVSNERAASSASNNGITTRQLADSTVNLVIGQIRQATTQAEAAATATTWASQPGAIRTFSGTVGTFKRGIPTAGVPNGVDQWAYKPGANDYIFKLYSAENMKAKPSDIDSSNGWFTQEINVIDNWDGTLSESERDTKVGFGYTDLNSPIITPLPESVTKKPEIVQPRYPIIDPRAKFSASEKANSTADPGIVDGFDIRTQKLDDKTLKTQAGTAVQYLPMPVKWLYVMRDGSMAAADSKTGKIAGATLENPIVGRTAFWTDDESCKLNINTASEGTYWDTPTASSIFVSGNVDNDSGLLSSTATPWSLSLGASQPARGEYNRYPGHPATTSLSPALGWMGLTPAGSNWGILPTDPPKATGDPKLYNTKEAILQLAPFTPNWAQLPAGSKIGQTSRSGTFNEDKWMPDGGDDIPQLSVVTKRLYTTVDELVFKSTRNDGTLQNATALNNDFVTPDKLEKVRFFLTANSRSPELNLFGRPRVTFWPVNTDVEQRTGFDDLFAFTSTLYKDPNGDRNKDNTFYFTRWDAKSPTNDYKQNPPNVANLPDNKNPKIMEYLRLMTGSGGAFPNIPGFGGCFLNKYTEPEKDQVLQEIFDYCRTVNLVDTSKRQRAGQAFHPYTPFYGKPAGKDYEDPIERSNNWAAQVTPIRINNPENPEDPAGYQGLGRFPTLAEAALVFYRPTATTMRATLLFEMTTPMPGYPAIRETFWTRVRVDRPTLASLDGKDPADDTNKYDIKLVGSPGTALINIVTLGSHDVGYGRSYLANLGFVNQLYYSDEATDWTDPNDPSRPKPSGVIGARKTFDNTKPESIVYDRGKTAKIYPYVSKTIDVLDAAGKLTSNPAPLIFRGGAYTLEIWSGEAPKDATKGDPRSRLVQTIHISFPSNQDKTMGQKVPSSGTLTLAAGGGLFETRLELIKGRSDSNWRAPISAQDVVRGLEYVGVRQGAALTGDERGDFRLAMAMRTVPDEAYQPRGGITAYLNATLPQVHGLQIGHCNPYPGYYGNNNATAVAAAPAQGTFAPNGRNHNNKPAILPADLLGVKRADGSPGDWDRGLSKHNDGSFANKVDEGNVWFGYDEGTDGSKVPYFRGRGIEETGRSFFTPNRQLASAVMFGSLPTGVVRGLPWQTLLFRPDHGTKPHPGAQTSQNPADHLLLDLFNLPVVEPYAISEPFSTGGKVNLNYVIAPFGYATGDSGKRKIPGYSFTTTMPRSYLRRDTALRGVFKAVKVMAVKTDQGYAGHRDGPTNTTDAFHYDIDAERTLDAFESRFKDPARGLFRSASEICDIDLYPAVNGSGGPSLPIGLTDWTKFWDIDYAQTGDNMRERPYAHIYPRVTTKSNVYTVHMRCQAVKKVPGTDPAKFDPKRDKILGEYRGQATVERFIDPNDPNLEKYDATSGKSSVDPYYRFRVISTKQFLPR
jgi:uncharacterized protein (TIGR02600 family)